MIWSIAWKNVWRNKLRSLVVIFAVMAGLLGGAFGVAFIKGMGVQRTFTSLHNEISHIQIHNPGFQDNNESKYSIQQYAEILAFLKNDPDVVGITGRMLITGMASTSNGSSGGMIYGIDPEIEKTVTNIYQFGYDSTDLYFETERKNQVFIGEKLAKTLKLDRYQITDYSIKEMESLDFPFVDLQKLSDLKGEVFRSQKDYLQTLRDLIGKELTNEYEYYLLKYTLRFKERASVILTFQDKNGEITGGKFRVCGIYKTSNPMFDETSIFVRKNDLSRLTGYNENTIHEIAVLLTDKSLAKEKVAILKKKFPNQKIEYWGEISPELVILTDYMDLYNFVIIGIILAALAFGIINTMLMAIIERTKELGMLAAIGMNKQRRFIMIMLETVFLSLVGAVTALLINFFLMLRLSETGIDISKKWGQGMESVGYDTLIYPVFETSDYINITLMVIIIAILSSIYPAIKAIRLKPAEAVRTDA